MAVCFVSCAEMMWRTDFNTGSSTVCCIVTQDTSAQDTKPRFALNHKVHEAELYQDSYIPYDYGNCHIGATGNTDLPGLYKL
jgi:hypothetical protein